MFQPFARPRLRFVSVIALGVVTLVVALPGMVAAYDWPAFGGPTPFTGLNRDETQITPGNVGQLHRLFRVSLPDTADGAPAVLTGVQTTRGTRDALFLTTRNGSLVALDAHTGEQLWVVAHGPGDCKINNGSQTCYTTSSPAIDPDHGFVYSYGLDGKVHKHAVMDGTETTDGSWPQIVSLKPYDEKGSSALAVAVAHDGTRYLYVAHAGYPGDHGDYQGHLTTINLGTGEQKVFNTTCSDQAVHFAAKGAGPDCGMVQSAVWARQGVVYSPDTDRVYFTTGNASVVAGETCLGRHGDCIECRWHGREWQPARYVYTGELRRTRPARCRSRQRRPDDPAAVRYECLCKCGGTGGQGRQAAPAEPRRPERQGRGRGISTAISASSTYRREARY